MRKRFAFLISLTVLGAIDPPAAAVQGAVPGDPSQLTAMRAVRHRATAEEALSRADRALITVFTEGRVREDRRFIDALAAQQNLWRKYAAAECEVAGSAMNAGDGPLESNAATECEAQLIEQRVAQDEAAVHCLAKASSWTGQDVPCLDSVTPLVQEANVIAGK